MAALDDGVENLQQFCGLLAETNSQVEETTSALEAHGSRIGELEEAMEDKFGSWQGELQDFRSEMNQGHDDDVTEMQGVGELAQDIADSRLADAQGDLDGWEDGFESKLASDRGDLDQAFSGLESDGFDALHQGLEAVGAALTQSGEETAKAFETIDGALEELQQRMEEAASDGTQAMDEVAQALVGEDAERFKSEVAEDVAGWSDELPAGVDAGSEGVVDALVQAYDTWGAEAETQGDELIEGVATLAEEAADALTTESGEELGQGVEVADQAMEELLSELGNDQGQLEAGAETTDDLGPLTEQLEICQRVVTEVDKVLNAVGE